MSVPKPPEEPPAGAPAWIVTFTDMMSLLLTFFVLLLTFTTKNTGKLSRMSGALRAQFGGIGDVGVVRRAVMTPDTVGKGPQGEEGNPAPFLRQDFEGELSNLVQDKGAFKTQLTFDDVLEGIRLKLHLEGGGEIFRLGTADLEENARQVLSEMGDFMRTQRVRVVIEVWVDGKTWKFSTMRDPWELTAAQAQSVAAVLEKAGMTPELIAIAPKGEIASGFASETAVERAKNRRVEMVVMPLDMDPLFAPVTE